MMLGLHMAGGVLSVVTIIYALIGLSDQVVPSYLKRLLPLLAAWQLVSGIGLVMTGGSLVRICGSGSVYLAVMGVVYWRLRQVESSISSELKSSN